MMTIDLAKLAEVTGGGATAPRPVAAPTPSPTVPTPIIDGMRSAIEAGGAPRSKGAAWVGWGQDNTGN